MTDARRTESQSQNPSKPRIEQGARHVRLRTAFVACALAAGLATGCDSADPALAGDPSTDSSPTDADAGLVTMADPTAQATDDASVDPTADASVDPTADAGTDPSGGASGLEAPVIAAGTSFFVGSRFLVGESPTSFSTSYVPCDPLADTDTGTRTFSITTMHLPATSGELSGGFDLDTIDNSAVADGGSGLTIPGCGAKDRIGGVDNALGNAAASLGAMLPIDDAFDQSLVAHPVTIRVTRYNGAAVDTCVAVTVDVQYPRGVTRVTGAGRVDSGVITASFATPLTLAVPLPSPTSPATKAEVAFTVRDLRARLVADASLTTLYAGSYLGGLVFWDSADPAYDTVPALRDRLDAWGSAVGLDLSTKNVVLQAFGAFQDLRMSAAGAREDCTGATPQSTNRNSISIGLELTSLLKVIPIVL